MAIGRTIRAALAISAIALAFGSPACGADNAGNNPATTAPAKPAPGNALDRFEASVKSLNLTEEQKPKIDKFFETARQELKALADDADAAEREQKSHAISTKLRSEIGEVLTNEQKTELIKKMPPPADTDATIDRIKKELNKPGSKLTADQKEKVNVVLDDTKKKLEDLRAQARESHADVRPKVQEALKEMREKLSVILQPKE